MSEFSAFSVKDLTLQWPTWLSRHERLYRMNGQRVHVEDSIKVAKERRTQNPGFFYKPIRQYPISPFCLQNISRSEIFFVISFKGLVWQSLKLLDSLNKSEEILVRVRVVITVA